MAYQYRESDRKSLSSRQFDDQVFYFDQSTPTPADIPSPRVRREGSSFVFDDPAWFPVFDRGALRSHSLPHGLFLKILRWSKLFASKGRPVIFARVRLERPQGTTRKQSRDWLYVARFV